MPVPFPLYQVAQDFPDGALPPPVSWTLYPVTFGSTTITVASTVVIGVGVLPSSAPVRQWTIYNNGSNPIWVTEASATVPAVSAAVGQGIILNPGDLMIEENWPEPSGTVAIAVGGSSSAVWTAVQ